MKYLILICTFGLLMSFSKDEYVPIGRTVVIKDSSSLQIVGTTNVHTFHCKYDTSHLNKPMQVEYTNGGNDYLFSSASLKLFNENFDCGGRAINRDFHKLLKTPEHPQVEIGLSKISPNPRIDQNYDAHVNITIAGVTREYTMPLKAIPASDVFVKGVLEIELPDFNLEAPHKAFGMIRVDDRLVIEFLLEIELV